MVQIACNLEPIIAVVVLVHDAVGDLAPSGEPRRSVCKSERRSRTRRVPIRKIEANQRHLFSAGEPSEDVIDLGHCPAACCRILQRHDRKVTASASNQAVPDAVASRHGAAAGTPVNHHVSIKLRHDRTTYSSSRQRFGEGDPWITSGYRSCEVI